MYLACVFLNLEHAWYLQRILKDLIYCWMSKSDLSWFLSS